MAKNDRMVTGNEREEVASRAAALAITGSPDAAVHHLGVLKLGNGDIVTAHVIHAVDPVITDGKNVVLINRRHPPGEGMPALPGGLIDPAQGGGVESAVQAAAREALEEVGIRLPSGELVGSRAMYRPHDVRRAAHGLPQYEIKEGDVFMVSAQAVLFHVKNLCAAKLSAGDDAEPGSARIFPIRDIARETMGIPDHYDMIMQALQILQKQQNPAPSGAQAPRTTVKP